MEETGSALVDKLCRAELGRPLEACETGGISVEKAEAALTALLETIEHSGPVSRSWMGPDEEQAAIEAITGMINSGSFDPPRFLTPENRSALRGLVKLTQRNITHLPISERLRREAPRELQEHSLGLALFVSDILPG